MTMALEVKNLESWYGESHILHGVNFAVRDGEVVTLLGRNGAGRSTILKSILVYEFIFVQLNSRDGYFF